MANYTEHYGLHQWVPEDDFLRTDFNTDFALIDTALAGLAAADSAQTSALAAAKTELQGSITSGDNNLSLALSQAQTALQNAITSGDNAQAAALSQAQAALQQALSRKLEIITGSFVGNAAAGTTAEQAIQLGFQPSCVIFGNASFRYDGQDGMSSNCVVLYPGVSCSGLSSLGKYGGGRIGPTGFFVNGVSNFLNTTFQYIALRTV